MLTTIFERRWPSTSGHDARSIEDLSYALLDAEGEVSGIALAQAIIERYATLDVQEKNAYFQFLNDQLEIDVSGLETALTAFKTTGSVSDYKAVATRAEAQRQELLRRLNQAPGATHALVGMRTDLLEALKTNPELARTDLDFQHLLRSWFNRGFLVLRQISWETPASILEKIVRYEAVHAIQDWDDLRRRLYPQDRRCFAFFHPSMPDEPLIFVEVALTMSVPHSIQRVLSETREQREAHATKVAVFYSISNCQAGLKGVSFGNLLIKQVAAELQQELPGLETFVTLSPIPGFVKWISAQKDADIYDGIQDGTTDPDTVRSAAAHYLLSARSQTGAPYDPVARFHLGNGAQIYAVHGGADTSDKGLRQSAGAMVNYEYDLSLIEQNHERFVQSGIISTSPAFSADGTRSTRRRKISS